MFMATDDNKSNAGCHTSNRDAIMHLSTLSVGAVPELIIHWPLFVFVLHKFALFPFLNIHTHTHTQNTRTLLSLPLHYS